MINILSLYGKSEVSVVRLNQFTHKTVGDLEHIYSLKTLILDHYFAIIYHLIFYIIRKYLKVFKTFLKSIRILFTVLKRCGRILM